MKPGKGDFVRFECSKGHVGYGTVDSVVKFGTWFVNAFVIEVGTGKKHPCTIRPRDLEFVDLEVEEQITKEGY